MKLDPLANQVSLDGVLVEVLSAQCMKAVGDKGASNSKSLCTFSASSRAGELAGRKQSLPVQHVLWRTSGMFLLRAVLEVGFSVWVQR